MKFSYVSGIIGLMVAGMAASHAQNNLVVNGPVSSTPGSDNVFVGTNVGAQVTNGIKNTFLGNSTGNSTTSGSENTFVGYQAGYLNYRGANNVYVGTFAGGFNGNGSYNTFMGWGAGGLNTNSSTNVFVGYQAGWYNTGGYSNVVAGNQAGMGVSQQSLGNNNIMIGDSSGFSQKGAIGNVFVGSKTGYANVRGAQNTFLGYQSGNNAVADSNTFVGYQSGFSTTTGIGNTFFGSLSGRAITTGSHNTIVGHKAGSTSVNSDDNVYIGYATGQRGSGSRNTFLGTGADASAHNLTNATAIGAGAEVSISDALVLGNKANIGIGTSAPTARLHIRSERADESGLRLENLTSNSLVAGKANKVLTVNERGDVLLAQPILGKLFIEKETDWADRVFEPGYTLLPLAGVKRYIETNRHLPNMPSAAEVVKVGYDPATMDARLLEKVEETMRYVIQLNEEIHRLNEQNRQLKRALYKLKKR
ncbi:hypothetical protein [Spirosoma lituiforme]